MNDTITRAFIAELARTSIETMQTVSPNWRTPLIDKLHASFQRIEDNEQWTAEQALIDHINVMTLIAHDATTLKMVQSSAVFTNCESMIRFLLNVERAHLPPPTQL
jgi:hypothetical protein